MRKTRPGISMTLTILVVALVLLATTIALMTLGTNVTDRISQIVGGGQGSETDLARQHCERRRDVICAQADLEQWEETGRLDQWAEQASYESRTCAQWQEDESIYGSSGIPECNIESPASDDSSSSDDPSTSDDPTTSDDGSTVVE